MPQFGPFFPTKVRSDRSAGGVPWSRPEALTGQEPGQAAECPIKGEGQTAFLMATGFNVMLPPRHKVTRVRFQVLGDAQGAQDAGGCLVVNNRWHGALVPGEGLHQGYEQPGLLTEQLANGKFGLAVRYRGKDVAPQLRKVAMYVECEPLPPAPAAGRQGEPGAGQEGPEHGEAGQAPRGREQPRQETGPARRQEPRKEATEQETAGHEQAPAQAPGGLSHPGGKAPSELRHPAAEEGARAPAARRERSGAKGKETPAEESDRDER